MNDRKVGLFFGITAFTIWGLNPIYWKFIKHVPAYEILAHRSLWALVFVWMLVVARGEWPQTKAVFGQPRVFMRAALSAACLGANWYIYVYAINSDRILDTSLGYYINPLFNVFLGVVFLGERLRRLQWMAVLLVAAAVSIMAAEFGRLPWISLGVAITFGFYGLLRKTGALGSINGFLIETMALTVPSVGFIAYWEIQNVGQFTESMSTTLLLIGTGLITAVPLMCFARGVRSLPLSTMGLIQYFTPTCTFLLGIFVYGERFTRTHLVTFGLIWFALILYSVEGALVLRRQEQLRNQLGLENHTSKSR